MATIDVLDAAGDTQTIAKIPATGQAAMADSLPVVIASDQSDVPVTVASSALPTGASTEATLADVLTAANAIAADPATATLQGTIATAIAALNTLLTSLDGKTTAVNTGAVAVASSALPTGAATEATLAAQSAKLPAALGSAADSGSLSVAQSTEGKAAIGALTETAPASDTASSGLNGRLQRIAQRITSLIALLPSSLGIKTAANSLSVAPASDAVFQIASATAAPTSISGTITTGATAQNAASANSSRKGFMLQNNSTGDLWFSTLATAVASQPSIKLPPGAYYESPLGAGGTGAISIIGATTGQAWSGREW